MIRTCLMKMVLQFRHMAGAGVRCRDGGAVGAVQSVTVLVRQSQAGPLNLSQKL